MPKYLKQIKARGRLHACSFDQLGLETQDILVSNPDLFPNTGLMLLRCRRNIRFNIKPCAPAEPQYTTPFDKFLYILCRI